MLITYGSCRIHNKTQCSFEDIVPLVNEEGDWVCPECGAEYVSPREKEEEDAEVSSNVEV